MTFFSRKSAFLGAAAAAVLVASTVTAGAETIRIGYWSSGVSLGLGAVLKAGKFFEKQGFDVKYVTFPDVNAPTKAMAAGSIDFAIGASAGSALAVTGSGVPVSVILATQVADLDYVVPQDSPIKTLADLKGKKVGTSPAGSATASISAAILDKNYNLKPADYQAVPGNDTRLAQFLVQGDIDAAALRTVSLALVHGNFRVIGSFRDEWAKITGTKAAPILGVGMVRDAWLKENPDGAEKIVKAMKAVYDYGKDHPDQVASDLVKAANLSEADAKAYAKLWPSIYSVEMDDGTMKSFQTEFDVFKSVGTVSGSFAKDKFLTGPYEKAMAGK